MLLAATPQQEGVVQALLEGGADPNGRDAAGSTALMHACTLPSPRQGPMVSLLLRQVGIANIGSSCEALQIGILAG